MTDAQNLLNATSDGLNIALGVILDSNLKDNGGPTKTHLLKPSSPALDAATTSTAGVDQRGATRPQGVARDIGAVEVIDALANAAQTCIVQVNTKAALVSKAQNTESRLCIQNAGRGREDDPEACLMADAKGKVAKDEGKVTTAFDTKCDGTEPIVTDDTTTNGAHTTEALALVHAVFGNDLTAGGTGAVIDPGNDAAKCQEKVWQQASQLWDTKLTEFVKCKKAELKQTVTDVASLVRVCLTPSIPDLKDKIDEKQAKLAEEVAKQCDGLDTDVLFPGECVGEGDFAGCVDRVVECHVCQALNAADGLSRDCDHFDDLNASNGSCS